MVHVRFDLLPLDEFDKLYVKKKIEITYCEQIDNPDSVVTKRGILLGCSNVSVGFLCPRMCDFIEEKTGNYISIIAKGIDKIYVLEG